MFATNPLQKALASREVLLVRLGDAVLFDLAVAAYGKPVNVAKDA